MDQKDNGLNEESLQTLNKLLELNFPFEASAEAARIFGADVRSATAHVLQSEVGNETGIEVGEDGIDAAPPPAYDEVIAKQSTGRFETVSFQDEELVMESIELQSIGDKRSPGYDLHWWNDLNSKDQAYISQYFRQKKEYSSDDLDELVANGTLSMKTAEDYAHWYFDGMYEILKVSGQGFYGEHVDDIEFMEGFEYEGEVLRVNQRLYLDDYIRVKYIRVKPLDEGADVGRPARCFYVKINQTKFVTDIERTFCSTCGNVKAVENHDPSKPRETESDLEIKLHSYCKSCNVATAMSEDAYRNGNDSINLSVDFGACFENCKDSCFACENPCENSEKFCQGENSRTWMAMWGCCCCIGLLLLFILTPLSFASVPEDDVGFLKNDISKKMDFKVYEPGHHNTGPGHHFEFCNGKSQVVFMREANSWTCPENLDGSCNDQIYKGNSSENNIGAEILMTFSVMYKVIHEAEQIKKAYDMYAFNDEQVNQAVSDIAAENCRQSPQHYSVKEIVKKTAAHDLAVLNVGLLDESTFQFGYKIVDVLVHEYILSGSMMEKYFKMELKRYEDDIIKINEEARVIERETETQIEHISNEANVGAIEMRSYATAYANQLEADGTAYVQETQNSASIALAEMLHRKFPNANYTSVQSLHQATDYMNKISKTGAESTFEKAYLNFQNS